MDREKREKIDKVVKTMKFGRRRLEEFDRIRRQHEIGTFTGALEIAIDWFIATYPLGNHDGDGSRRAVLVALGPAQALGEGVRDGK